MAAMMHMMRRRGAVERFSFPAATKKVPAARGVID